jgi:hypothetical protein
VPYINLQFLYMGRVSTGKRRNLLHVGSYVALTVAIAVPCVAFTKSTLGEVEEQMNPHNRVQTDKVSEQAPRKGGLFEYTLFEGSGGEAEILQVTDKELLFRSGNDLVLLDRASGAAKWRFHDPQRLFWYMRDHVAHFEINHRILCIDVVEGKSWQSFEPLGEYQGQSPANTAYVDEASVGPPIEIVQRPCALGTDYALSNVGAFKLVRSYQFAIPDVVDCGTASQLRFMRIYRDHGGDVNQLNQPKRFSSLAKYKEIYYMGQNDGSLVAYFPNRDPIERIERAAKDVFHLARTTVEISSNVPTAKICLDDLVIGCGSVSAGPLLPGFYRVLASAPGFLDAERTLFLDHKEVMSVQLSLESMANEASSFDLTPMLDRLSPVKLLADRRKLVIVGKTGIALLDSNSLAPLWSRTVRTIAEPVLWQDRILAADHDSITVYNWRDGAVSRSIEVKKQVGRMHLFGNVMVCSFGDGSIAAYEMDNGVLLWKKNAALCQMPMDGCFARISRSGVLSALLPESGRVLWKVRTSTTGALVGGSGANMYLYDDQSRHIYAYNSTDGTIAWRDSRLQARPEISESHVAYYRMFESGEKALCLITVRSHSGLVENTGLQ